MALGASSSAASRTPPCPSRPGRTGVPSMRWWSRNGCCVGSRWSSTTSPSWTLDRRTAPTITPSVRPSRGQTTRRVVLRGHQPELAGDDHLTGVGTAGQLAPDPGDARLRRQHLHPGHLHDLGDRATGGHADAAPGGPVQGQAAGLRPGAPEAWTMRLAEQVVGRGVVGLAVVAEPTGHRAEDDRRARTLRVRSRPGSTLNQPSAFTSKTRSNSRGSLSGRLRLISTPAACRSRSIRSADIVHRGATARRSVRSTLW